MTDIHDPINEPLNEPEKRWQPAERQAPVPGTSMLPGSEKPAPAAVSLLKHAVRGAHDSIDRLAAQAEPAVRQLGESVAAAEDVLHSKAVQLREVGQEWAQGLRCSVRSKPLTSIALAAALGMLLARITRVNR